MNIELVIAVVAFAGVLIALTRALAADGYGMRPGPRSHAEDEVTKLRMPHDEPRRSGR